MSIPVLICPILNRPDLLTEMLASINHPVDQTVVIDNGGVVPPEIEAIRLPHNIGVAASWNLGIKVTPKAPWWLFVNNDIRFGTEDLAKIEAGVDSTAPMILFAKGYSAFAVTGPALDRIGLFEENLHPAYFEDNDFEWRARIAEVALVSITTAIKHVGSATIYSDRVYRTANDRTFSQNEDWYTKKWGGAPGREKFRTPWDQGGSITPSQPEPKRLRNLAWSRK